MTDNDPPWLRDLEADLGPERYGWIGQDREGGSRGEFMAIGYDRTRLRPVEYDHFWLSGTPQEPGSNTWGGDWTRMVTWVRFHDLSGDGELFAANTHFDDASAYARRCSAELLAERLDTLAPDVPWIVTGDFNTLAGDSTVHAALLTRADLVDTWEAAEERGTAHGTFHDYRPPVPGGDRIDWILASRGTRVRRAMINRCAPNGRYPSDRLPVQAILRTAR